MDKLVVYGGARLSGTMTVSGAKNAALPMLAATLLSKNHPVILHNVPHLRDVTTMLALLAELGAKTMLCEKHSLQIDTRALHSSTAPYDLVKQMRASILVLGPLLARFGQAKVSLPGGCTIGQRPVDQHLQALERLGAVFELKDGYIEGHVAGRLQGAPVTFDRVTVTGTENLMMAAALAEGRTEIYNAACEPEIVDLANCLNGMGARIQGAGGHTMVIDGVDALCQVKPHTILADRIEAGTYLAAAAMTRGDVTVQGITPDILHSTLSLLEGAGAQLTSKAASIRCQMSGQLQSVDVNTAVYPGFPTDMQAQLMVLNAVANGSARVTETIFENRFMHVQELVRMGADIVVDGHTAIVKGVPRLVGAQVMATDLRASACLVLAGLVAEGQTVIDRIYHLCRGYERIEEKLQSLGAKVGRLNDAFEVIS